MSYAKNIRIHFLTQLACKVRAEAERSRCVVERTHLIKAVSSIEDAIQTLRKED